MRVKASSMPASSSVQQGNHGVGEKFLYDFKAARVPATPRRDRDTGLTLFAVGAEASEPAHQS
jgi:hypothetical protein